jgi:tRNA A37 threonylcarbamoyladenosine synthetase subunit TsaC/SUA5/YrdC
MDGLADVVLKGGITRYREESTIVDLSEPTPRLVREGVVTRGEIEAFLGCVCGTD